MEGGHVRADAKRSTSLSELKVDTWKIQTGADQVLQDRQAGALVGGLSAHYAGAQADVDSPFGAGRVDTTSYGVGAALTWFGAGGFYADGQAQFSWYESDLDSVVLGRRAEANKGEGQAFSLEVGQRAPIASGLTVTPQAQVVYSKVDFDGFTDDAGADVSLAAGESLKTRVGLTLDRAGGGGGSAWRSHLYGIANVTYEWKDTTVTSVAGEGVAHANDRLWGQLGVGGALTLGGAVNFYGQVTADTSLADFGESYSVKGVAGLRIAF